jgi:hypothetical protein
MRYLVPLLTLTLLSATADAQVYKRVDEKGNVTYSDEPGAGAEPVTLPEIQFYTPPKLPASQAKTADEAEKKSGEMPSYKVSIASPAQEATVIQNDGTVVVSARVEPALRPTEKVAFFMDGVRVAEPGASTSITLSLVDRGSHVVKASIVDATGATLAESGAVTFFLKRFFRKPATTTN